MARGVFIMATVPKGGYFIVKKVESHEDYILA